MTQDHKKLSIDSALRQLLGNNTSNEMGDYADFLEKLAGHDKNNVLIDEVIEEKLEFQTLKPENSWKRIIAIIWYRRLRNMSFIVLTLASLIYGVKYVMDRQSAMTEISIGTNSSGSTKAIELVSILPATKVIDSKQNDRKKIDEKTSIAIKGISNMRHITANTFQAGPEQNKAIINRNHSNTQITGGNMLVPAIHEDDAVISIGGFAQFFPHLKVEPDTIYTASYPALSPNRIPKDKNYTVTGKLPKTGFIISLHVMNSFQNYHSSTTASRYVNRNYNALANNGRKTSHVLNYGLSIERHLFRGLGLSLGVNKFTLRQEQQTDFLLTEAPVIDIDGSISYFDIPPERIQATLENRINYVSVPFNVLYGLKLSSSNSIQVRFGSAMLYQVNKQTEKFDYKTLDLGAYNHQGNKFSFNTLQYGLAYTRNLKNNFMLSLGFERQILYKIDPLSDRTEKTRSSINNLTISLQYKL
jgi:hypothetical protein